MGQLLRQRHGDGADGAQVLRHVLPYPAVAAGGAADEHAVPILQRHGQAVHLGLHAVQGVRQVGGHLLQKVPHLLAVEYVLQALQRHLVPHLLKLAQELAAHPLGGGIRCDLLRMLLLQVLQPPQQVVVLIVRHGGRVQHIVEIPVGVQGLPQLLHFFTIIHGVSSFIRCS